MMYIVQYGNWFIQTVQKSKSRDTSHCSLKLNTVDSFVIRVKYCYILIFMSFINFFLYGKSIKVPYVRTVCGRTSFYQSKRKYFKVRSSILENRIFYFYPVQVFSFFLYLSLLHFSISTLLSWGGGGEGLRGCKNKRWNMLLLTLFSTC